MDNSMAKRSIFSAMISSKSYGHERCMIPAIHLHHEIAKRKFRMQFSKLIK